MLTGCFLIPCYQDLNPEDFDTELEAWRQEAMQHQLACRTRLTRLAGECNGGRVLFLREIFIDTMLTRFFDADSGQFLGKKDSGGFLCGSTSLVALQCPVGIVTESFCDDSVAGPVVFPDVGDTFHP